MKRPVMAVLEMFRPLYIFILLSLFSNFVCAQDETAEPIAEIGSSNKETEEERRSRLSLAKEHFLKGHGYFKEKKFPEALKEFRESLYRDPDNLALNHLIGKAAYETGDYEESVFAYERALVLDPNHALSRLEKARAHLALGSKTEAKTELEEALERPLPNEVRRNVESLLAQCNYEQRHHLTGLFIVGYTWDSNITLGTANSVPSPFDPSFVSDPTQASDQIANFTILVNHNYSMPVDGLTWKNSIIFFVNDVDDLSSNDLVLGTINSGFDYSSGRHLFGFAWSWSMMYLDDQRFQHNHRILLNYMLTCTDSLVWRSAIQYTKRHHFGTTTPLHATFGLVSEANSQLVCLVSAKDTITPSGFIRYDKTPRDGMVPQAYYRYQAAISYSRVLSCRFSASTSFKYKYDSYENYNAIYTTKKRKDHGWQVDLSVSIKVLHWLTFGVTGEYIDNDSNIPTNVYTAKRLSVTGTSKLF